VAQRSTSLASLTLGVLRWGERHGLDRDQILHTVAIDERALHEVDGRISAEAHLLAWRETERVLGDPDFALRSASSLLEPASFGVVGLLAMTSPTVGDSLGRAVRYGRVINEGLRTKAYVSGELLIVELETHMPAPRTFIACALLAYVLFMRRWTGQPVSVRRVSFRHDQPEASRAYEEVFACPVDFGQPNDAVVFDREVLDLPLVTAQDDVAAYLERRARALDERLAVGGDTRALASSVADAVRDAIDAGDVSIAKVARRLGASTRTVQRALAKENLEFRQIVDDVRSGMAIRLVTLSDTPIEAIAERLGYAEAKAFRRAFRRWSGVSPSEMRCADRVGDDADDESP